MNTLAYIFVIFEFVGILCFITAIFDMLMNGSRYASWAGIGLTIAVVCFGTMGIISYWLP